LTFLFFNVLIWWIKISKARKPCYIASLRCAAIIQIQIFRV